MKRLHNALGVYLLILLTCCNDQARIRPELSIVDTAGVLNMADSLRVLGLNFEEKGNTDSVNYYFSRSLELKEELGLVDTIMLRMYLSIASGYLSEFKYEIADNYLQKARLMSDSLELQPHVVIDLYLKSANAKENQRDIPGAGSYLQKAFQLVTKHYSNDSALHLQVYHLLSGNAFYNSDYLKAIDFLKASLRYIKADSYVRHSVVYNTMGMAMAELGRHRDAIRYFDMAIASARHIPIAPDRLAIIYVQKAHSLQDIGLPDSAYYLLKENLRIRERVYGNKNVNTFGAKYSLGEFFLKEGEPDSAVYYFHQSLTSLLKDFDSEEVGDNPIPDATECNSDIIISLVGKARSLNLASRNVKDGTKMKELALGTYLLADSVFYVYRNSFLFDDPQFRQLEEEYIPYDEVISLSIQLYHASGNQTYLNSALMMMEQSRASVLQNSLARVKQFGLRGLDLTRENELKRQRVEVIQHLGADTANHIMIDSLNSKLISIEADLARHQNALAKEYPNYLVDASKLRAVSVSAVQLQLKESNSSLIEYYWGADNLYGIAVTPDSVYALAIDLTSDLRSAINIFMAQMVVKQEEAISRETFSRFCESAFKIYEGLVSPFLQTDVTVKKIVISGHGPLSSFPFDALITKIPATDEVDYHLDYLADQLTISYAYSASLLLQQFESERHGTALLAMGFAGDGPSRATRDALSNLPGTEREILEIKDVMKNSVNRYLLEDRATESAFRRDASNYNIIHLAMHGIADTLDALNSRLVFRRSAEETEDGVLYAHELYDMDMRKLDLAVLSACETGMGKVQKGEGVMSIARGFAYAGCPSLVISLWKIDDLSASHIMGDFYRNLSSGQEIDVSLTNAKADYRRASNEFNSHPSYWAAFLSVGDIRPIRKDRIDLKFWGTTIAGILLLAFGILVLIRARAKTKGFDKGKPSIF